MPTPVYGEFDYTVGDVRPLLAQWNNNLLTSDLTDCEVNGAFYNRANSELQEALGVAGYSPSKVNTPQAWQICHDTLTAGVALYFIESRSTGTYSEGFDALSGAFGRYRGRLNAIKAGQPLGELGIVKSNRAGVCHSGQLLENPFIYKPFTVC